MLWPASLAQQYRPASRAYCIRRVTYYDAKLFECWPAVSDVGPTLKQHRVNVSCLLGIAPVINSRHNTARLTNCWARVVDGVPALKQRSLLVIVQRYACLPVWSVCPRGIHKCDNNTQLTQGDVESMLVQHLSTIYDVGPTLSQLYFNVLSLLACQYTCMGPIYNAYRQLTAQQNKHSLDVALMLGELHRRWSNSKPAKKNNYSFVVKT